MSTHRIVGYSRTTGNVDNFVLQVQNIRVFKNNVLLQYDKRHSRKETLPSNFKPQRLTLIWHFC